MNLRKTCAGLCLGGVFIAVVAVVVGRLFLNRPQVTAISLFGLTMSLVGSVLWLVDEVTDVVSRLRAPLLESELEPELEDAAPRRANGTVESSAAPRRAVDPQDGEEVRGSSS